MPVLCKDISPSLLVVEGKNDCHGIYQIAAIHGLEGLFGIWEAGSDKLALQKFGGMLAASENKPNILGLVLDCDVDEEGIIQAPARRWAQFKGRLQELGYNIPDSPDLDGTILDAPPGLPRVGVWLMPDNRSQGMFEDFLLPLIPVACLDIVKDAIALAQAGGATTFKAAHHSKAMAHLYILAR